MIRVDNTPRDYAWGSSTAIAALRGLAPSGSPEAELWLGTHPGSPTRIVGAADGEPQTIAELLSARGEQPLPYLLKILAAAHPLSIQAHPSPEQAREGFARDNAAGIPLDAPHRNYRDDAHKPELIVALSTRFDALCGFRPLEKTLKQLELVALANDATEGSSVAIRGFMTELRSKGEAAIEWALNWVLGSGETAELVAEVARGGVLLDDELLTELAEDYPGDPGIVIAMLLNHVHLHRGQALYLPAGNMHAYIRGLGIELMAASDNVLRGGLTTKHVDVDELLSVVIPTVLPAPVLEPVVPTPGLELFRPDVPDFELARITGEIDPDFALELTRPAIAVCTEGTMTLRGESAEITLQRGEIALVLDEQRTVRASGAGEIFIAI
jgi:mannose-6-phosphate isomerase